MKPHRYLSTLVGHKFGPWTVTASRGTKTSCSGTHKSVQRLWECACTCGQTTISSTGSLQALKRSTCYHGVDGLLRGNALPPGVAACNALVASYRGDAKERDIEWHLTRDEARALFLSNCHYCGIEPRQKKQHNSRGNGAFTYNGIDRVDNTQGYTTSNTVSCCGPCNNMKKTQPQSVFLHLVAKIFTHKLLMWEPSRKVILTGKSRSA